MDTEHTNKVLRISGIALVIISVGFAVADTVYRIASGISFANRDGCFIFQNLSPIAFIVFENFIELGLAVYIGSFIAVILEKYIRRLNRFVPKNPVAAFILGSIMPICSCSAVPLIKTMRGSSHMRTILTFVVAAPLLNPYIIYLSYTVLGSFYGTARIAGAFVLSVSAGYVIGFFSHRFEPIVDSFPMNCRQSTCSVSEGDIFLKTIRLFISILPFLAIGALISIALAVFIPRKDLLLAGFVNDSILGHLAVIGIGIPLYFCNGVDVFILRPLMYEAGLSIGTAIEFSLTSNAICITSILMLIKILGKRLTAILVVYIALVVLVIGYATNYFWRLMYAS